MMMEDIELDFGAITIDNSTLKNEGYRFNEGLLKQMEQFANGPVKVIQTDIVHNEAKRHIADVIVNSRSSIEKALRSASIQLQIDTSDIAAASDLLSISGDALEIADKRLREYYAKISAEVLESHKYIDFERLLKSYFDTKAPFEGAKDKKNEFPDAIALISLERWADEHDINIIAVSSDKGWADFAEQSDRITVIDKLSNAIAKFQPHNQVNNIIEFIRKDALLEKENVVLSKIEEAIASSLESAIIFAEASSAYRFEDSDVYATYIEHELDVDEDGLVSVNIVRIEDDIIVLQVNAIVVCEISADFSFYVRDDIDKDEFVIGSTSCCVEDSYETDILISLTGNFSKGFENIEVANIEVIETIKSTEFGEIEPDWRDYEEDE
jgi:hypothetical protein